MPGNPDYLLLPYQELGTMDGRDLHSYGQCVTTHLERDMKRNGWEVSATTISICLSEEEKNSGHSN